MTVDPGPDVQEGEDVRLSSAGRQRLIVERIRSEEFVSVKDLALSFGLTEMSMRRDLNTLAEKGLVERVWGGARRALTSPAWQLYAETEQRNLEQKERIAACAAELLAPDATVFFYSGTTVARVATCLNETQRAFMTIVTPSLPVIDEVSAWANPHLVGVGGLFLSRYLAFAGPQAVTTLRSLRADVAVLGCDGLSVDEGLSTPHQLIAEVGSVLVERADRTVVVADSSKIGRKGFTPITDTASIHALITDSGVDLAEVRALREAGVEVHVV